MRDYGLRGWLGEHRGWIAGGRGRIVGGCGRLVALRLFIVVRRGRPSLSCFWGSASHARLETASKPSSFGASGLWLGSQAPLIPCSTFRRDFQRNMLVRPFVIALTVVTEAVACGRNYEDTIRQGVRPSDRSQNDHARRIYREQVATQAATGLSSATHRGEAQGVLKRSNVVSVRSFGRRVSNVRRNGRIGWRESLALRWTRGGCSSRKTANGIAQRHEGAANGRSVLLYYPNLIGEWSLLFHVRKLLPWVIRTNSTSDGVAAWGTCSPFALTNCCRLL